MWLLGVIAFLVAAGYVVVLYDGTMWWGWVILGVAGVLAAYKLWDLARK